MTSKHASHQHATHRAKAQATVHGKPVQPGGVKYVKQTDALKAARRIAERNQELMRRLA